MFRKYSKKRQPNLQFLNQPLNIIAFIFYLYMQNIEVTYTQANRHTCLKIIRQNGYFVRFKACLETIKQNGNFVRFKGR